MEFIGEKLGAFLIFKSKKERLKTVTIVIKVCQNLLFVLLYNNLGSIDWSKSHGLCFLVTE